MLGADHVQTTSYHPKSNGIVERSHRQLRASLKCELVAQMQRAFKDAPYNVYQNFLGLISSLRFFSESESLLRRRHRQLKWYSEHLCASWTSSLSHPNNLLQTRALCSSALPTIRCHPSSSSIQAYDAQAFRIQRSDHLWLIRFSPRRFGTQAIGFLQRVMPNLSTYDFYFTFYL